MILTGDGNNIVAMSGQGKDMRRTVLAEVRAYWEGLRAGHAVPLRSAVDPRGIERALEYAFILERVAPGIARFRLAGMHLNDLMGMEVRGMPITAFFAPANRSVISETLESVFQGPAVAELTLMAETGFGKGALEAKLLLLPLRSDLGDITRVLGCLVSHGQIGRTPRRFDVVGVKVTEIVAGRPAEGPVARPAPAPARAPAFAEAAAPFKPASKTAPYLRVVHSSD